jgi:hypothetical protein
MQSVMGHTHKKATSSGLDKSGLEDLPSSPGQARLRTMHGNHCWPCLRLFVSHSRDVHGSKPHVVLLAPLKHAVCSKLSTVGSHSMTANKTLLVRRLATTLWCTQQAKQQHTFFCVLRWVGHAVAPGVEGW